MSRDAKFRWFRTYADIVDNSKIRLLAFEDRWHFVALCALKCDGLLERDDDPHLERKIALKLGLQVRELEEVKRRLMDVGLILGNFSPAKWEMRQHRKNDLPEGESLDGYKGYVYFIGSPKGRNVKIGYSKNPWARVRDLQTGRAEKLSVVATVKTTEASEGDIHSLFEAEREAGEWFRSSERIQALISAIKAKEVCDTTSVVDYVSSYVAATKETETETEKDIEPKGSRASDDALTPADVLEGWNTLAAECGLPIAKSMKDSRLRACKARLREYPEPDAWLRAFRHIRQTPFLRGDDGKDWRATIDFVLQASSFTKLTEESYGKAN